MCRRLGPTANEYRALLCPGGLAAVRAWDGNAEAYTRIL